MNDSTTTPCHLCGNAARLKFKDHTGYQNTCTYDIYHCDHCYTAFASPLKVNTEIYNLIYSKIDQVPGYERYLKYSNQVLKEQDPLDYLARSEDMYWSVQQVLKKLRNANPTKQLRILEIGCGFGYLTYALAKSGYDVSGIDISQVAVDQAIKRYGHHFACADVREYAKKMGAAYDIIILTEVIEHIENVIEFLSAADQLLLPGGNLIVTTPNRTPYPADMLWETEPPPVHLWWFSEQSTRSLANKLGHKVTFVDFTDFNIQEVDRLKGYLKPATNIRNFQPSRLPRFDENGEALTKGNVEVSPPPAKPHPIKSLVKRGLASLGVLKSLAAWKDRLYLYRLKRFLRKHPQPRPTLCAVFHKPTK